ncbi:MAG: hypothetical protein R3F29_12280 [Planctomycetota bacterium]
MSALVVVSLLASCAAPPIPRSDAPLTPLLTPGSFDGWKVSDDVWSWQDDVLACNAWSARRSSALERLTPLPQFELQCEFRLERGSGWTLEVVANEQNARGFLLGFAEGGGAMSAPMPSKHDVDALMDGSPEVAGRLAKLAGRPVVRQGAFVPGDWTTLKVISSGCDAWVLIGDEQFAYWSEDGVRGACNLCIRVEADTHVEFRDIVMRAL